MNISLVDVMISISQKSQQTEVGKCLNTLPLRIGTHFKLTLNSPCRLTKEASLILGVVLLYCIILSNFELLDDCLDF